MDYFTNVSIICFQHTGEVITLLYVLFYLVLESIIKC